MKNIMEQYYKPLMLEKMFHSVEIPINYPKMGECWKINEAIGGGYLWIYTSEKHYNIKIHNFWFHKDTVVDMAIPEVLSVTWYDSIAGEELQPYRQLQSQVVKSFLGGDTPFHAVIHKRVPIKSIGIEYEPTYYEPYLKSNCNQAYNTPHEVFRSLDETKDFPKMTLLLKQLQTYRGIGLPAEVFFDAKAAEALSLIFEHHSNRNARKKKQLSAVDQETMENLKTYINHHYADSLDIEQLSKLSYMGTTKLKSCFKSYFDSTISDYIVSVRINQAEHLLSYTELPIAQIAHAVGYSNASYFSEQFRKAKGVLPLKYRKATK